MRDADYGYTVIGDSYVVHTLPGKSLHIRVMDLDDARTHYYIMP